MRGRKFGKCGLVATLRSLHEVSLHLGPRLGERNWLAFTGYDEASPCDRSNLSKRPSWTASPSVPLDRRKHRVNAIEVSRVAGLIRWAVRCRRHEVRSSIRSDEAVSSGRLGARFVTGWIVSWMSGWETSNVIGAVEAQSQSRCAGVLCGS